MTKKILTILAATLMVSGAWADQVTKDGVTYNATFAGSTDNTSVNNSLTVSLGFNNIDNSCSIKNTATKSGVLQHNYNLSISSFGVNPIIDSWTENNITPSDAGSHDSEELTYTINVDSEYATYAALLRSKPQYYNREDLIAMGITKAFYGPTERDLNGWFDEKRPTALFVVQSTLEWDDEADDDVPVNKYYCVQKIKVFETSNNNYSISKNYNITSIPTGLSWTGVNNVTIGNSITSIADGAFVGATDIEAYNASGTYSSDVNKCLKKGNVLVMAPNTFSNNTKTLPAGTYTSINSNAFNNVHDAVVYLNGNVASYSGGTNNTFIGTTLASGSVKNSMLVGGGYTIPASISTINEGAFKDATELTSVSCTNVSGSWTFTNGILYNTAKTTVLLVTESAGNNITLPNSVTRIADYALANVTGVTVNSSNSSLTWGSNQGGNTINKPSATLTYSSANGGRTFNAGQILTNSNLASAISSFSGSYLDFSNCSVFETINLSSISLAKNVLLYLPAGTVTSGSCNNVVIGNTCANLVIEDKVNRTFHAPKSFTATNVSYNRSIGTGWSMVVLPFDVPASKANQFDYFKLTNYNTETNTFTFGVQSQLLANTAYLLKSKSGSNTFSTTNATVQVTDPNTSYGMNGATFHGTFSQINAPAISSGTDYYYGLSGGKLVRFDGSTIYAFRSYITAPKANYHDAPEFRFEDEDGFELNEEGFANSIEYVDADLKGNDDAIFNLNGVQVSNMNEPGVYVNKNKKIIIK